MLLGSVFISTLQCILILHLSSTSGDRRKGTHRWVCKKNVNGFCEEEDYHVGSMVKATSLSYYYSLGDDMEGNWETKHIFLSPKLLWVEFSLPILPGKKFSPICLAL